MGLLDSIFRQAGDLAKEVGKTAGRVASSPVAHKSEPASGAQTKNVSLSCLPGSADEMRSMAEFDLRDPYTVAALTICALNVYPTDREKSKEMLNVLKGPEPLSPRETQFINDRFMDGKAYVTRSYFGGTSPDNDYTVSAPYTVTVLEYANSRENEGYIRLFLKSSGADSERPLVLRNKPSTGEWFLWEFESLLAGIRIPKSTDKWA